MSYDHNDIYNIVERLAILEGRISPTSTKHGLNKQQKSVPQLPALFKPKHISVLGSKTDPKHPMSGYAVGADESVEDDREAIEEAVATEDVLEKVKKSFADYLSNVADEIKQDTDLKDKKKEDSDLKKKDKIDHDLIAKEIVKKALDEDPTQGEDPGVTPQAPMINPTLPESKCVKSITNECGLWEVHGNEADGFQIHREGRCMPSRFKSLDEAVMALEMFAARRRAQDESQDYIEEA